MAIDWHELMIPQRTVQPSIAHASEQLDSRCSQRTHHCPQTTASISYTEHLLRCP